MTEQQDTREKWGNFNITDEQAERINNGDVEEFDLFFLRNYDYIKKRCQKIFFKKGIYYDYQEGINSAYVDLRFSKLKSGRQMEKIVIVACAMAQVGGHTICRQDSPQYDSYYNMLKVDSGYELPADRFDADDKHTYFRIDHYGETAPSPQEEIEQELELARANNVDKLCEILSPFLTPLQNKVLPFFLNGITATPICEHLGITCNSANKTREKLRNRLILNYDKVLAALIDAGYPLEHLEGILPENYDKALMQVQYERRKADEATKRWRERKKEHISEYNRCYAERKAQSQLNTS